MNNLRLLAGLLWFALPSGGVCSFAQRVISLEEIYASAEAQSAQLRPSFSAQEEAEKEISVAKSAMLPDINASLSLSYIGDGFTTKRDFTDLHKAPIPHFGSGLGLTVNQPVYTGGAIKKSIEMAELKSTASRFATDLKRDNLRFQLTGFYLDLYRYENLRRVVESNISSAQKVLEEMKVRHQHGTALRNDITRYELLVSNLEVTLTKINNTIKILNDNLVTTAGLPSSTVVLPDSTILSRALPKNSEDWWTNEAIENSPAIALAGKSVELNKTGEKLVKADLLPKVGLQAAWTMDGPILVEVPPINRNLSYWYVGIGVNYNLSSLYKSNKALAKSRVAIRKASEELEAVRENVELAVRADYVRYLEAYEELKSREKSVELAEQNYATTSTRFSEGMALITDMLDATDARLSAQQMLVDSKINIIYYYYKLLFTSGTI